jgi:hypothetical protein
MRQHDQGKPAGRRGKGGIVGGGSVNNGALGGPIQCGFGWASAPAGYQIEVTRA